MKSKKKEKSSHGCSALIIISALMLNGCATVWTKANEGECMPPHGPDAMFIYGGVRCDAALLFIATITDSSEFLVPLGSIIDMPLSLAADTIVLPWSIYQHFQYKNKYPS